MGQSGRPLLKSVTQGEIGRKYGTTYPYIMGLVILDDKACLTCMNPKKTNFLPNKNSGELQYIL